MGSQLGLVSGVRGGKDWNGVLVGCWGGRELREGPAPAGKPEAAIHVASL